MNMKKIWVLVIVLVILGAIGAGWILYSSNTNSEKTLSICAGAGLMKPMNELVQAFENKTGVKVEVHYGGSAEIFGILETTGCDVFIPGAYYYTEEGVKRGYIVPSTVKNITYHIPVIAVPKGNPKNITSLSDLAKKGVRVVLGDPKGPAIGKVAKKILENAHLWENVSKNVVTFAPTVNQLLIYLTTGEADAAIIWEDLTTWSQAKGKIQVIQIPPNENIIKTIPTAVTTYAKKDGNYQIAVEFNNFVYEHKEIWEKWGFKPCQGS